MKATNSLRWFLIVLACVVTTVHGGGRIRSLHEKKGCNCPPDLKKIASYELPPFIDISVKIRTGMVTWDNLESKTKFVTGYKPQKHNQVISTKIVNVTNHMGTHVDTPGHMDEKRLPTENVDTLDLRTLNGPALVVEVPQGSNITGDVMSALNIPRGVTRVLFKTDNSDKKLWDKPVFYRNYTAFVQSGATWLVQNTDIKLVGIDYLSTATYDSVFDTHSALLSCDEKKIVPLEGLDLRNVAAGWHLLNCLPLNVAGLEGSPTRCIAAPINIEC